MCEIMNGWAIVPPDEIYRSALWLVQNRRPPWPGAAPELQRTCRYLRKQRGLVSAGQPVDEDPTVSRAFKIARSSPASQLVRGLVLADVDVVEIARHVHASKEAVGLFEQVFWNVRPHLKACGYTFLAIESLGIDAQQAECLRLARAHGADVFLQVLGARELQPDTVVLLQRLATKAVCLRALAAMQRPMQSAQDAARDVRSYLQLRKLEMKEMRERLKLQQMQRQVEAAAVNLDKNTRTQRANLKAERQRLEELAAQFVRRERTLAEREAECARMMAEAQQVVRENEKPTVATPALAALRQDPNSRILRPWLHVG